MMKNKNCSFQCQPVYMISIIVLFWTAIIAVSSVTVQAGELLEEGFACYENQDYESALVFFERAAEMGSVDAQYMLGDMYRYGEGVETDYQKAIEYYEMAAAQEDAWALSELGYMYEHGEGVEPDIEKAIDFYEKGADAGSAAAMNNLGYIYECGEGVDVDYDTARAYYEQAVELGNDMAMLNLGQMYELGEILKDYQKAEEYYQMSAELGNESAQTMLERLEGKKALPWIRGVSLFDELAKKIVLGTSTFTFDDANVKEAWSFAHSAVRQADQMPTYVECDFEGKTYHIYAIYDQVLYGIAQPLPVNEDLGLYPWDAFGDMTQSGEAVTNEDYVKAAQAAIKEQESAFAEEERLAVYKDYLSGKISPELSKISGKDVNVRIYPGDGEILAKLSDGDEVLRIMDLDENWTMIEYEGRISYISTDYLLGTVS